MGTDLLCPVEHLLLLLGSGALAPQIFLLSLCLVWLWAGVSQGFCFVVALSKELQVRGNIISHGLTVKKL